jgi:gliding motility-associated-like protein
MKFRILYIVFFVAITGYAQLPAFTLQAVATNETCSNNGTLTLTPGDLTPSAVLEYSLYKLPNMTAPISQFTDNLVGGLDSGDYLVRAIQTLGADASPVVEIPFTISDQTVPLVFTVDQATAGSCSLTGTLVATVSSGSGPFFYQIVSGSQTSPPQLSNQFPNLPGGEYLVRVIDNCGEAEVFEYTLVLTSTNLNIGGVTHPPVATSCTTVQVNNDITPSSGTIFYPLTVEYTIHFPAPTGDQIIVQQYPTGPPDSLPLSLTLPVENVLYTYDLMVTDSCGHIFPSVNNEVDPNPKVAINDVPNECGDKYITVAVSNVMPPYTMSFIDPPVGFDAAVYNPDSVGPLTALNFTFGSDTNTVPYGIYHVVILDACGRTGEFTLPLIEEIPDEIVTGFAANCTNPGRISIQIEENRKVATVIITVAPAAYAATHPLPSDVSPTEPVLSHTIVNLPEGHYEMTIIDACGDEHSGEADIDPFDAEEALQSTNRPSCSPGAGSLRLRSPNGGGLTSLTMISAPPEFEGTLPLNLTGSLTAGNYFNGNLPAGTYNFIATDACGGALTTPGGIVVMGYISGANNFEIERNCGTFNLSLHDSSNSLGTYWFQKKNPDTGLYGHPDTGEAYPEGTAPNDSNSIMLANNSVRLNINNTGTFRILKVYQSYDSSGNTLCFDAYDDFTFSGDLEILGAYSLDCFGGAGPSSVFVNVLGVPPYTYRILEKNGQPFIIENGTADIFQDLDPALYKIEVQDACTRTVNITINVATLLPLVDATDPGANGGPSELLFCSNNGETTATFDLTTFNSIILGNQSPDIYTISYYVSQTDAETGDNPITTDPTAYVNTANPQTIFVRVVHNTITLCPDITSFQLFVGTEPTLTILPDIYLCEGDEKRIFADNGYDAYEWSTGVTTRYIDVDTPGTYTVTVKNAYGNSFCEATQTITVTNSESAHFESVDIQDWSDFDNSFTMHVSGDGDYVFSIDGLNYQPDPTFTGLEPGLYTVDIKDLHGCPGITKDVLILNYPKFFTPNGDGYNDKWKIKNAVFEPGMMTYIFDRYGKLITGFDHDSQGWDGTYNGQPLPSTDYWFMVERIDGKVHRGHFAMKR